MQFQRYDKAKFVSQCLELAILFEVSADKPGNVNFVVGFEGTNHAHFLASAVAASRHFELAAERGMAVSRGEIDFSDVRVGRIIRDCVMDINFWQSGGNTLLGTVILLSPLAVAAGLTPTEENYTFKIADLRRNLKMVVESTTPEDAVNVYEAIKIAKPSGLGKVPDLDVNDPNSVKRILKERISLFQVFKIAAEYDNVCSEWINNYPITFDFAYPRLQRRVNEAGNLDAAIIHTFLEVLAEYPDSFIARKAGLNKAREISLMAREILSLGGLKTAVGKKKLHEFDLTLRKSSNLFNPGTTADIIATALALMVLSGYKP
ncbi:MAG: triphosphoribosyl-dephospho-CoA synthase [Candidatus Bathyarchaeia archaeon]